MSLSQVSTAREKRSVNTRGRVRTLLAALCVLLITLIGLEVAVRVWGYSQRHLYDPIYKPFEQSQDIPYIHKPNLVQAKARGFAVVNTDSLGLRAKSSGTLYGAKQPSEYRIAIAGDSVTFGDGIARTEDTFAQVLEESLNQQQAVAVKVFNYGASAYSVKEMAATLQYRMFDIQPDLVMIVILPQDFNLARTPTIDESGYQIDWKLSQLNFPNLKTRQVLREIHLTYVLRDIGLLWFFKRLDIPREFSRGEIPESYRYIQRFKEMAQERGLAYAIVLLPPMWRASWGPLPEQLARDRITHVDLSFLWNEFTAEQYMASRFDPHPSAAVHHRIGEELANYVRHNELKIRGSDG